MDCDNRLYVEIVPMERGLIPHPHPISEAHFDPAYAYKVLGMYNPSETSECYLILANPDRELWFIPQRHTRAYALIESTEFSLPIDPHLARRPRPLNGAASEPAKMGITDKAPISAQLGAHRANGHGRLNLR